MFELEQQVDIIGTRLTGVIKGKSMYSNGMADLYWVKYVDSQGNPQDRWFVESEICKRF